MSETTAKSVFVLEYVIGSFGVRERRLLPYSFAECGTACVFALERKLPHKESIEIVEISLFDSVDEAVGCNNPQRRILTKQEMIDAAAAYKKQQQAA